MKKILFLLSIALLTIGCDRLSPTPVSYRVYVLDKWQDTTEYTTTTFHRFGQATVPMRHHHTRINNHIKFVFWNLEEPLSPMGNIIQMETVSDAYYNALEKDKAYLFTEKDEYELGLRQKEKWFKSIRKN